MALTVQQILDAMTESGLETKEQLVFILKGAVRPIQANALRDQIKDLRAEQAAASQAKEQEISVLQAQIDQLGL